jgi:hypothetical protein
VIDIFREYQSQYLSSKGQSQLPHLKYRPVVADSANIAVLNSGTSEIQRPAGGREWINEKRKREFLAVNKILGV